MKTRNHGMDEREMELVRLYSEFGMRIIRDMTPTARKAEQLRSELISAKNKVKRITEELKESSMK